jgi:hypothetical protein
MPNKYFSAAAFAHRHNFDGTWDSICTRCFLTVASEWTEVGLWEHERGHHCDSLREARYSTSSLPDPLSAAGGILERRWASAYVEAEDDPQ